jgi:hypothetical protein
MPLPRKKIDLSDGLDDIMNFNDPRPSDAAFEKELVDAVYSRIVESWTCGTDDGKAYDRAQEVAQRRVDRAIAEHGLADRDAVITDIFNAESDFGNVPASLKPFLVEKGQVNRRNTPKR